MSGNPRGLAFFVALAATVAVDLTACSAAKRNDTDFDGPVQVPSGAGGGGAGSAGTSGDPDGGVGGGVVLDGGSNCVERTFVDAFKPLRTLYLAPNGNDGADGASLGAPWRSLANASRLQAGDLVEVAPGSYPCGVEIALRATAAAPVLIRASGGRGTVVFDCAGSELGISFVGAQYVALDGLVILGAREDNVRISAPQNAPGLIPQFILVRNSRIEGAGASAVRVLGGVSIDIFSNEIARTEAFGVREQGQGLDLVGVVGARVLGNRIHDIPGDVAIQVHGGSNGVLIDGNTMHTVSEGLRLGGNSTPAQFLANASAEYELKGAVVVNNIIHGTVSVGMSLLGCESCLLSNNTMYLRGAQSALRAAAGNTGPTAASRQGRSSNVRVLNSIFAFTAPSPQRVFDIPAEDSTGFVNERNLFFSSAGPVGSVASTPPIAGEASLIDEDPRFVDPATGNVRPGAGSPTLGRASFVPEVKRDGTGACRTERDIGAL